MPSACGRGLRFMDCERDECSERNRGGGAGVWGGAFEFSAEEGRNRWLPGSSARVRGQVIALGSLSESKPCQDFIRFCEPIKGTGRGMVLGADHYHITGARMELGQTSRVSE